jgi:fatty acid-binding protein DegV
VGHHVGLRHVEGGEHVGEVVRERHGRVVPFGARRPAEAREVDVDRAAVLAGQLQVALPTCEVIVCPVGGVVGAHVGPGMVAVVVSPRVL